MLRTLSAWGVEGSSLAAAPALTSVRLTNASFVDPLLCGDAMVGLSGVYAGVNGIRLALAHGCQLTASEVHMLMDAGLRFLTGRLTPHQVFNCGCRVSLWRALVDAMVATASRRLCAHLRAERLIVEANDRAAAFAAIEKAITECRPVLMLCRGGSYTVVRGFTPSSLLLFDSAGSHWIAKHACGVPGDNENTRHMLYPASLMTLNA